MVEIADKGAGVLKKSRYEEAGVNIDKANALIEAIKPIVTSTFKRGVLTEIGGFSGLFALDTEQYKEPVLVASTDGVGTKIKIAIMANRHDTIGIDLVAMCVNDIVVCGASPLFFLDYFSTGQLENQVAEAVIKGIADGCKEAGCALIGGETAEMPGLYQVGEYDLAGFVVGVVERNKIIDGSEIGVGNVLIGLASNGIHSNGYSLVRKIFFDELGLKIHDEIPGFDGKTVADELLVPTKIYVPVVLHLLKAGSPIKGIVHITGGGFFDNIPRILPSSCKAVIKKGSWPMPPIFNFLQERGDISKEEMFRTFNCGIGMILVVPEQDAKDVLFQIQAMDEKAFSIGYIAPRKNEEPQVVIENI
ncbi:Phosphoribosylformylglycinamidine cyclo-ligase [Dissulfuribacter thermophilus]|uniref:Phosphoribosylformylglycinamidine cyclo-ligase n=1 Tax=Dissulfuribacter thermophilus TaxID=1156395 RepID=A0A1B9F4C8_9BACT|nr:phosphoribosylformylglycinamidine cyclo-ligase [Dissulfuribacter thermophilus]OCC14713.1 Phosphoribosylformylglycinamidine cyclo-ligase [Dissulfuribacter thermophilus]